MIPALFVAMAALPQTPTGKTDRLRLPAVPGIRPDLDVAYTPPATRLEEQLVKIWADALGIDQLGIHDPFQELGGDSLMAMRVIARIKDSLGVDLPVTALFDRPTIAETATTISGLRVVP
jgi:acyl carrier protein